MKSTPSSVTFTNSTSPEMEAGVTAEPLRALRRGLTRADGFGLYVAVVKTPAQRNQLINLLQEALPATLLQTVALRPDTTDILDAVLNQLGGQIPGPIMVVGLEEVLSTDAPYSPILQSLNLRRPDWPKLIHQPVVFWVPEYLLGLLGRAAPDFLDWRSDTLHFPDVEPTQLEALQSATWDGGLDTRMPVAARLERIKELQSRIIANENSHDPVIRSTVIGWLNELGLHLHLLGRTQEAMDCFEKCVSLAREIGDRHGEGAALGNLGIAHRRLGDVSQAIGFYEQQLVVVREIGDRRGESRALGNLGNIHIVLGNVRQAMELIKKALLIYQAIGDRRGEGNALDNFGNAHATMGDWHKAIEFYEQALVIAREIGDRCEEGNALGNLGIAHRNLGDARKAIEFYGQQLVIAREIGDRRGEGNALGCLGSAHATLGDMHKAMEFYELALVIAREIGDRRGEGNALGNLGVAHSELGDARKAIEFYDQVLVIAHEIGDRRGEGGSLWNSALALDSLGDRTEAITRAAAALAIFESIEAPYAANIRATLAEWRTPQPFTAAGPADLPKP